MDHKIICRTVSGQICPTNDFFDEILHVFWSKNLPADRSLGNTGIGGGPGGGGSKKCHLNFFLAFNALESKKSFYESKIWSFIQFSFFSLHNGKL